MYCRVWLLNIMKAVISMKNHLWIPFFLSISHLQIVCTSRVGDPILHTLFVAFRISSWWVDFYVYSFLFFFLSSPNLRGSTNQSSWCLVLENCFALLMRAAYVRAGFKNDFFASGFVARTSRKAFWESALNIYHICTPLHVVCNNARNENIDVCRCTYLI